MKKNSTFTIIIISLYNHSSYNFSLLKDNKISKKSILGAYWPIYENYILYKKKIFCITLVQAFCYKKTGNRKLLQVL